MKHYLFSLTLVCSINIESLSDSERIAEYYLEWDKLGNHQTFSRDTKKTIDWVTNITKKYADYYEVYPYEAIETKIIKNNLLVNNKIIDNNILIDSRHGTYKIESIIGQKDNNVPVFFNNAYVGYGSGKDFLEARASKKYEAVIRVNDSKIGGFTFINAFNYEKPTSVLALQVGSQYANFFKDNLGKKIVIDVEIKKNKSKAFNIYATIFGKDRSLDPITIITPYTGWSYTVSERGGGIAAWLELLKHFHKERPLRTIIFSANSGHELNHIGNKAFISRFPEVSQSKIWFHLGANWGSKTAVPMIQTSSKEIFDNTKKIHELYNFEVHFSDYNKKPIGEAKEIHNIKNNFISILDFQRTNIYFHNDLDRWPESVDVKKTNEIINFLISSVDYHANN